VFVLAVLILFVTVASQSADSPDVGAWTDAGMKHGVALAFRENRQLAAREVRAEKELSFSAQRIFTVVCDFSQYTEFMPGIVEASILEGTTPGGYVAYLRYAPRFVVVAARDVVLKVDGEAGNAFHCQWSSLPDRLPRRKDAVRMPLNVGSWAIKPEGPDRARVVYQVAVKPGGSIPDWLVRWGAARALPEAIEAVEKRLASPR
jgi:ribosome-associated toxin RatA of RatAB toxin-antitoxin module